MSSPFREVAIQQLLHGLRGEPADYLPADGNVGDALIHASTLRVFAQMGIDHRLIEGSVDDPRKLLIVGGSGNLVDPWDYLRVRLEALHQDYQKVLILPSTVAGRRTKRLLRSFGRNVFLVCRERVSYHAAIRWMRHPENVFLSPDMALHCDYAPYQHSGSGTLNAFRLDAESSDFPLPDDNIDLSDQIDLPGQPWRNDYWQLPGWPEYVEVFLRRIGEAQAVRTNRLHVALAAVQLDKEVELHANSYFKNQAVYEYLWAENPLVRFVPAPPVPWWRRLFVRRQS